MPKGVPNKRYTPEFKKLVIETMQEEKLSYSETCRRFEVNSRDRIKSWERIYLEEGPEGFAIERRGRRSKGRPPKQLPKQVEEDLLADAKRKGTEVVFTTGGAQSNHAMLTAGCAKKLGMEPILILKKRGVTERKGNQLLEYLMDTDVRFMDTDSYDDIYAEMDRVGKAFAGLVKMAREGQFKPTDNVLYLYSGGLFAIDIELDCVALAGAGF